MSDEGNVIFSVQVDTWVDDVPIDVDAMSLYACTEEVIPDIKESDPDAPVLSNDGSHDISAPHVISKANFDEFGYCDHRIKLVLTPKDDATVEKITATFSPESEELFAALVEAGYENGRIDITQSLTIGNESYANVSTIGNAKMISVSHVAMRKLFEFAGTHTVTIAATDSKNRTSYTDITIEVRRSGGAENGPVIEWLDHDLGTRYTANDMSGDDCCVINIGSASGITGFLVDIGGGVLTPKDLQDLGLDAHMDLINPATDAMDAMLLNLGFKTKDDVRGAKELQFNISSFMPMLVALNIPGPVDFKLTVTDAEGTVSGTIMLTVK